MKVKMPNDETKAAEFKRCSATSNLAAQVNQQSQPLLIGFETLPAELLLNILIEACLTEVLLDGVRHQYVMLKLSAVCKTWKHLVAYFRPRFIDRIIELDPTYDYGPESRTIEILPDDESIFRAPNDTFMSSLAAGENQLYFLHRDQVNIVSIVVCNAYGWDVISRQRHISDTFRFQIARRLSIGKLDFLCNVRCLQFCVASKVLYFVETKPVNIPAFRGDDSRTNETADGSESDSGNENESESGVDFRRTLIDASFTWRVHSVTGQILPRWRIDDRIRFPYYWSHKFITIDETTGNVIVPDAYNRRVLEYSADGILLHDFDIGGNVPVIQAFRLPTSYVTLRIGDDVRDVVDHYVTSTDAIDVNNFVRVHDVRNDVDDDVGDDDVGNDVVDDERDVDATIDNSGTTYVHDDVNQSSENANANRLSYLVVLRPANRDEDTKFCFRRICYSVSADAQTMITPVQVMASYDSVTPLLDVIDVSHGRILFAEWSRGCDCCSVHCHVRLHRVDDLRASRRDDVHEPVFDRRAVERSRMLCFDRQSRMLYIAGSGRIHCVNIWRNVDSI